MKIKDNLNKGRYGDERFTIKCSYEDLLVMYALFYRTALGGEYDTPSDFIDALTEVSKEWIGGSITGEDTPSVEVEIEKHKSEKSKVFTEDKHLITLRLVHNLD